MDYKYEGIKYTVMEFMENYRCNRRNCSSNFPLKKLFQILIYQPNGWRPCGRLYSRFIPEEEGKKLKMMVYLLGESLGHLMT
jgi:hypothetical protein